MSIEITQELKDAMKKADIACIITASNSGVVWSKIIVEDEKKTQPVIPLIAVLGLEKLKLESQVLASAQEAEKGKK